MACFLLLPRQESLRPQQHGEGAALPYAPGFGFGNVQPVYTWISFRGPVIGILIRLLGEWDRFTRMGNTLLYDHGAPPGQLGDGGAGRLRISEQRGVYDLWLRVAAVFSGGK